jgi:hypothetical protein
MDNPIPWQSPDPLAIELVLRGWEQPNPKHGGARDERSAPWTLDRVDLLIVIDTETSTDATCALDGFPQEIWGRGAQKLLFGRLHFYAVTHRRGEHTVKPIAELLFHADDLPESGMTALRAAYAAQGKPRYQTRRIPAPAFRVTADGLVEPFDIAVDVAHVSRTAAVQELLRHVRQYERRALVVGYNLPFDLSRLATDWRYIPQHAEEFYRGGFSLGLLRRENGMPSGQHPRIELKTLQKGAAMRWSRYKTGRRGEKPQSYLPVSNLLDASTLVWALMGHTYSLKRACQTLGCGSQKTETGDDGHGIITADYVRYNRDDVLATSELTVRLLARYQQFGLSRAPLGLYSGASLTKATYPDLGVVPRLRHQPKFWHGWHGAAMESFFGGRTECRIRKSLVPVRQLDFLSMYPTIWALMDLWSVLIADRVAMVDATGAARALVERITLDDLFQPETWRELRVLCLVEARGARLPVRSEFRDGDAPTIGILPDYSTTPRWVTLPDVLYAALTGKAPHIRRAVRVVPHGQQPSLRPMTLLGIEIDPRARSPITQLVEERARIKLVMDQLARGLPIIGPYAGLERDALDAMATDLKVIVCAAYGTAIELNPATPPVPGSTPRPQRVKLWTGTTARAAFTTRRETPGDYSFPLIGTLTTAGARLMLGLLELAVHERGGVLAGGDTDSAFIVCTQGGGDLLLDAADADGRPVPQTIRALSHADVDAIQAKFAALNPYDPSAIPGSILKIERVADYRGESVRDTEFYGLAAKAYVLLTRDESGRLRCTEKFSEFGLGAYRNPYYDPRPGAQNDPGRWKREFWEALVNGEPLGELPFARELAMRQTALSTPHVAELFKAMPWVAPFSFGLIATPLRGTAVAGDDVGGALALPFESDPGVWRRLPAYDRKTGESCGMICAAGDVDADDAAHTIPVRTLLDVLHKYAVRFNRIWLGPDGAPCTARTRGYLQHRPVRAERLHYIGKESTDWELRDDGLLSLDDTQTTYQLAATRGVSGDYPAALAVIASSTDPRAALDDTRHVAARLWAQRTPKHTFATLSEVDLFLARHPYILAPRKWHKWRTLQDIPDPRIQAAIIRDARRVAERELRACGVRPPESTVSLFSEYLQRHQHEQALGQSQTPRCGGCNAALERGDKRQRYCSARCRKRAERARASSSSQ